MTLNLQNKVCSNFFGYFRLQKTELRQNGWRQTKTTCDQELLKLSRVSWALLKLLVFSFIRMIMRLLLDVSVWLSCTSVIASSNCMFLVSMTCFIFSIHFFGCLPLFLFQLLLLLLYYYYYIIIYTVPYAELQNSASPLQAAAHFSFLKHVRTMSVLATVRQCYTRRW